MTPGTGTPRTFTYDAAGDILTDTRTGALGLAYQYDVEGRLSKTYQTNATANGATYSYDAQGRLSSRTVTQSSAPTSTTTLYLYDLSDHIIAEMDTSGQTLKEYIWLDDMPVAVVDGVNTATPTIYYVHVDHLMRPIRMTAQDWTWVWDVTYAPFGATTNLYTNPEVMNGRFPGQWFQLETGLAYNWHRHYDPTLGRYLQPDPLKVDDGDATISGIPTGTISGASDGHAVAKSMGWQEAHDIVMSWPSSRVMLQDGPSVYGYAGQNTLTNSDPSGLMGGHGQQPPPENGEGGFCPSKPPGDCTDQQHRELQDRVDNACGDAERCMGGDTIEMLQSKLAKHYACLNARVRINDTCFRGGDPTHNQAIDERENAIAKCWKLGGGVPK